jgi:hypothetical protein
MLGYYISQSNEYTFRTEPTASNQFTMSLQNMTTLENTTASLSGITFSGYESYIGFTASISGAVVASEYRAVLYNATPTGSADIWRGTIQVYQSQSIDKSVYENQIPPVTSHESENKYIIYN